MITTTVSLSITPGGIEPVVHVSQYDVGSRTLLFDFGSSYSIPDGAIVSIRGTKPDKTGFAYSCTVDSGKASVVVQDQMTACAGRVRCELAISQSGTILHTSRFVLRVDASPLDSATPISKTEIAALESLEQSAAKSATDSAASAAASAKSATESAASAAASAKSALDAAETAASVPTMTGATASAAGKGGTVPAPAAGKQDSALKGDGTYSTEIGGLDLQLSSSFISTWKSILGGTINVEKLLLNYCHPVGSLYISEKSTDPGTLFGGTWVRIKDKFILAAGDTYTAGSTGGEAAHTLTVSEMPAHKHLMVAAGITNNKGESGTTVGDFKMNSNWNTLANGGDFDGYGVGTYTTGSTGGGAAHTNMPPYEAYYVWKRTA
jgi:hypothetical protein